MALALASRPITLASKVQALTLALVLRAALTIFSIMHDNKLMRDENIGEQIHLVGR